MRGAVKFAKAGLVHGVAPILGADLAVLPDLVLPDGRGPGAGGSRTPPAAARTVTRTPARGGAEVDLRHPRVTVLARAGGSRRPRRHPGGTPTGAGWAALNRLVSATHLGTAEAPGERGRPLSSRALVADHAATGELLVLLGPDSEVGRALALRRPDLARAALDHWRDVVDPARLRIEVVSHQGPGSGPRLEHASPPGCSGSPTTRASPRCSPTPSATPSRPAPRPPTSSTPPAGSSPSTCGTSTGSTPRATSSPGAAMAVLAAEVSRLAGGAR